MGLEELQQEILNQAEAEAKRILDQARTEATMITNAARADAETKRHQSAEETKRLLTQMRRREEATAGLEEKRSLMAARKAVMDEAFHKAEQRFAALPAPERKRLIESLLKKASTEIRAARGYCNPRDASAITSVPTSPAEIIGGLIAENADGTLRIDLSFETLLAEIREKHLAEIAGVVFA